MYCIASHPHLAPISPCPPSSPAFSPRSHSVSHSTSAARSIYCTVLCCVVQCCAGSRSHWDPHMSARTRALRKRTRTHTHTQAALEPGSLKSLCACCAVLCCSIVYCTACTVVCCTLLLGLRRSWRLQRSRGAVIGGDGMAHGYTARAWRSVRIVGRKGGFRRMPRRR